jgi:hypothetical protein
MKINWLNKGIKGFGDASPVERFKDVVKKYGKPDIINPDKGGFAIWYKRGCYNKIMIKDEQIPHLKPKPHLDFLYTEIDAHIPKNKLMDVLSISNSIIVDQLKNTVKARCHFEGANIATLYIVLKVIHEDLTVKKIKSEDLYKKYIMSTMGEEKDKYLKLFEKYICQKVKAFRKTQDKKLRGKRR